LAHDAAQRVLEAPVLGDLPDGSHRHQAPRRAGHRPHHVGLGLPASRRRLAGFARVRAARDGAPPRRRATQDRLRERRAALRLRAGRTLAMKKTWRLYTRPDGQWHVEQIMFAAKQEPVVMVSARSLTPPGFELVEVECGTEQFIEAAADAEFYMGLARNMGGEFFRSAPKLKLVQLLSAGYDRVDVDSARKAKVPVANNGGANAIAVAEHTILLMLAVLKQLVRFHQDVVTGRWRPPASS